MIAMILLFKETITIVYEHNFIAACTGCAPPSTAPSCATIASVSNVPARHTSLRTLLVSHRCGAPMWSGPTPRAWPPRDTGKRLDNRAQPQRIAYHDLCQGIPILYVICGARAWSTLSSRVHEQRRLEVPSVLRIARGPKKNRDR